MRGQKAGTDADTPSQLTRKTVKKPEVCNGGHKKTSEA